MNARISRRHEGVPLNEVNAKNFDMNDFNMCNLNAVRARCLRELQVAVSALKFTNN